MMDDTGVLIIGGMPTKDGWRSETIRVRGRSEDVFVSPDGTRYVRAVATERADLIVRNTSTRFVSPLVVRFLLEQNSQLTRRSRREQRLVKQGEKQRERRAGFEPSDSLSNQRRKTRRVRRKR